MYRSLASPHAAWRNDEQGLASLGSDINPQNDRARLGLNYASLGSGNVRLSELHLARQSHHRYFIHTHRESMVLQSQTTNTLYIHTYV